MDFIGLILDILGLMSSRRSALRIKRKERLVQNNETVYRCSMKNTFTEYLIVLFPKGEIDHSNEQKVIWNLIDSKTDQKIMSFIDAHKKGKKKKAKLIQKYAGEYSSIVLKPNSDVQFDIIIDSDKQPNKIAFEIAFRSKLLNSKIHIDAIKL